MGRPRAFDQAEVTRAAAALFATRAYDGVSVDDLVAHLGVHRNSLYNVFGSKRGLYLAALRWHLDHQINPLLVRLRAAGQPQEAAVPERDLSLPATAGSDPLLRAAAGSDPLLRAAAGSDALPRAAVGSDALSRAAAGPDALPRAEAGPGQLSLAAVGPELDLLLLAAAERAPADPEVAAVIGAVLHEFDVALGPEGTAALLGRRLRTRITTAHR